jgi:hypothetical protein
MHQGSLLTLQGAGAYDAAVHCASVSAARRILSSQRGETPTHVAGHPMRPFDPHAPYTPRVSPIFLPPASLKLSVLSPAALPKHLASVSGAP